MDDDVDKYVKQKFPKGYTSTWRLNWWQSCQARSFCGVEYLGREGKEETEENRTWKELKEGYPWKKEKLKKFAKGLKISTYKVCYWIAICFLF